jgi:glycosyltransferase involved in cell wall biosynthesis
MIDVMIIAYNESLNLPRCLAALQGWTNNVFVVDSGSTDGTQEIARSHGATVVHHAWSGYARQKNWGLNNLPLQAPWTLILDADEVITPEVREKLVEIAAKPVDTVRENGFFINRMTYFLGRPIRHCGYYPSWNLRFFKRGKARYEDRVVHEHMIIDDPVGYIQTPMLHDDRRGLEHYVAKHNRYSTLEAKALYSEMQGEQMTPAAKLPRETNTRRWLKRNVLPHVPMPWLWRFLYMYVFRLGALDGQAGLEFCKFISMYDYLVVLKLRSLRRMARVDSNYMLEAGMEPGAIEESMLGSMSRMPEPIRPNGLKPSEPVVIRRQSVEALADPAPVTTALAPALLPATARMSTHDGELSGVDLLQSGPNTALESVAESQTEPQAIARGGTSRPDGLDVSILILTLNEESNLAGCLESVKDFDDIVVFDSYSKDRTVDIAKQREVRVVQRKFDNWSAHQNWAMENIKFRHKWVFYLDADERMTKELREELHSIANRTDESRVAFYCGRRNYFMGRWIKRSMPPGLIMRFFRPESIRFERLVNPTPVIHGEHGYLENYFNHYNFSKGVSEWIEKHNNYSRMEAVEGLKLLRGELGEQPSLLSRDRAMRRKAMKNLSFRMPFRPFVKFAYMYFIRLGILDGFAGLTYCTLQAFYEYMIVVKMRELQRRERGLPV